MLTLIIRCIPEGLNRYSIDHSNVYDAHTPWEVTYAPYTTNGGLCEVDEIKLSCLVSKLPLACCATSSSPSDLYETLQIYPKYIYAKRLKHCTKISISSAEVQKPSSLL